MSEKEQLLTEQQAWDVVQFATALNDGITGAGGLYNPWLQNQNLKELNNDSTDTPNYEKVVQALTDGMNAGERLQAYTEWMEWADMVFKRTIEYYQNLLSFDLVVTCKNAEPKDYQGTKYKNDRKVISEFLDSFDYKGEFRKVIKQMLRRETAFMWLRNNGDKKDTKYTLQTMPQSRCILTGYWERGLLYDFDMNYFLQPGIDIEGFDPIFKDLLAWMFDENGIERYIPTNPFNNRDGVFAYTVQTSPCYDESTHPKGEGISGAWAFKFDPSNFSDVPYLSALLRESILNIPIQKLQYDKDIAGAYAMLIGEIGMLDSGEPNATEFDPKRLGKLLQIVKNAIGKYVAVGAMPTREVEWYQYKDENTSMYQEQTKSAAASGAAASRIIYSSDKMSQEEIRLAAMTDYGVVRKLYTQFQNFLEFYANKMTKKFKFRFRFDGSTLPFERKDRQEFGMKLAENGLIGNSSYFASLVGMHPNDFDDMLVESKNNEFLKDLPQLMSVHTQSGDKGQVGAPTKDDVSSDSREYNTSDDT